MNNFPFLKQAHIHQTPRIVGYYDKLLWVKNNPFTTLKCKGKAKEVPWEYNSPTDKFSKFRKDVCGERTSWKCHELHPSCLLYFLITLLLYFLIVVRNLNLSQSCQHPLLE